MTRLLFWPITHPVQAIALVAMVTVLLASQLPRLQVDTSPESLMKVNDPDRRQYDDFIRRFGSDVVTLVVIKATDVFTEPVLSLVQRLSDALERLDDVAHVESLTTVRNIRGGGDTFSAEPLVDRQIPRSAEDLARIRRDALDNRVLVGSLVSPSARTTAIVVVANRRPEDRDLNRRLAGQIEGLIAGAVTAGVTVYQFGTPSTNATLATDITRDMLTFIPLSTAVLLLFLLVEFRMAQGFIIPLVTSLVSVVWGMGLMAVLGLPLNVLTVMVPAVLIIIGSTEDIHLLTEYHHLLQKGESKVDAIHAAVRQAVWPIVVTTGTTIVGFGSVATSSIPAQIHFGYASALGLTANFVVSLLLLPAMVRLLPVPRRLRTPRPTRSATVLPRIIDGLGRFDLRYRLPVAIIAALLMAASLVGWWFLRVDSEELGLYPPSAPIRQRAEDLRRSLTGFNAFYVMVDTGRPGGVTDPAVLRAIVGLQDFLTNVPEVDRTVSVVDYVKKMHREMNEGDARFETIPDTRQEVAQYLLTLEGRELSRYLDFDAAAASVVVRHHITGTWQLKKLLDRVEAYAASHFPAGASVRVAGRAVLLRNAADSLAINELISLITTFVLIGVIHSLFFRSTRIGLLSLVPNAVPVVMIYGIMGLLGIPLDIATALIATLAIGIAVDDTVHHVVTYRRQLQVHGNPRQATLDTLQKQARPILYISVALAAGFGIFGFSRFAPVSNFGMLSAVVMLLALAGELVLTPVVMYSTTSFGPAWRQRSNSVSEPAVTAPPPG